MKFPSGLYFKINITLFLALLIAILFFSVILYPFEIQRRGTVLNQVKSKLREITLRHKETLANELLAQHRRAILITLKEMLNSNETIFAAVFHEEGLFVRVDR